MFAEIPPTLSDIAEVVPTGPVIVRFWRKDEWKSSVGQLLRDLRLLLMQSKDAGVNEKRYIVRAVGGGPGMCRQCHCLDDHLVGPKVKAVCRGEDASGAGTTQRGHVRLV